MSTVHILGCGPAGLAAAHAAAEKGHDVRIFSKPRKSHMFGAQYLHEPIHRVDCGKPVDIHYRLQGSIMQYRGKVYGSEYEGGVSPEDLPNEHQAWDIRRAYDRLWDKYSGAIEPVENINPRWMHMHKHLRPMVSSIPLPSICLHPNLCVFTSAGIWAAGEAPARGITLGNILDDPRYSIILHDNEVICNGLPEPTWYRASRIFNHATIEWPWAAGPNALAPAAVTKPISNSCDCWPDVRRVGRYGKWEKGVLVHHAYEETAAWLASR